MSETQPCSLVWNQNPSLLNRVAVKPPPYPGHWYLISEAQPCHCQPGFKMSQIPIKRAATCSAAASTPDGSGSLAPSLNPGRSRRAKVAGIGRVPLFKARGVRPHLPFKAKYHRRYSPSPSLFRVPPSLSSSGSFGVPASSPKPRNRAPAFPI